MISERNGLSNLPNGWEWTRLGEIISIGNGFAFKSSDYRESGVFLIRQTNLGYGRVNVRNAVYLPQEYLNTYRAFLVQKGDVLVGMSGSIGKLCVYDLNAPALQNQRTGLIRFFELETQQYVRYFLETLESQLTDLAKGVAVQNISAQQIESCAIPLPPLPEQHRIVARIEELFTRLDAGVEALKKVKAQLKAYRKAVLKDAFEGKLTAEWREAHKGEMEPASVFLEQIKREREKNARGKVKELPPLDTSDLPELPEEWVWTRVGELYDTMQYGYTAASVSEPVGPKMLRITDIQNNRVDWDSVPHCKIEPEEKAKYILREGDLVFARTGATVGKSFLISGEFPEAVFASYLIRVIFPRDISKKFVYYFFQSNAYWAQIRGAQIGIGQPNVNSQTLSKFCLPLSPLAEQHFIVEEIERRFSVAEEIEKTVERGLKQAERLRQSILKRAFEGKLVPQDPTDEPAERLLERIKAEKASREFQTKPAAKTGKKRSPMQRRLI